MYPTRSPILAAPSMMLNRRLLSDPDEEWKNVARNSGRSLKMSIEKMIANAKVKMSSLVVNSSPSSSCCEELHSMIFIPSMSTATRPTTPLMNGHARQGSFFESGENGKSFTWIFLSGMRTAAATFDPCLIMTPSMIACPPAASDSPAFMMGTVQ